METGESVKGRPFSGSQTPDTTICVMEEWVTVSSMNNIKIEFDEDTRDYYIIWKPIIISSGKTRHGSLADLRQTAHFAVDALIDRKLKDIGEQSASGRSPVKK
jgi:orotidine-5'-phosphate decarboxylase